MAKTYRSENGQGWIAPVRKSGTFKRTTVTVGSAREAKKLIRHSDEKYSEAREGSLPEMLTMSSKRYRDDLKLKYKDKPIHSGHSSKKRWSNPENVITKHIDLFFAGLPIRDLTVAELHDFFDYLIDPEEASLSLRSAKHVFTQLRNIFNHAKANGVIVRNPIDDFRRSETDAFLRMHRAKRPEALSLARIRKLLNRTKGPDRLLVFIMLLAGLRSAEVCGLKWRHVDKSLGGLWIFESGTASSVEQEMEIVGLLQANADAKSPNATKTPAGCRFVPWTPRLKREIDNVLERLSTEGTVSLDAPVLSSESGDALNYLQLNYRIKAIQNSIEGLPRKLNREKRVPGNVSNHIFRHSCVALWITAGISFDKIATWIGHADPLTTIHHYGHFLQDPDLPAH